MDAANGRDRMAEAFDRVKKKPNDPELLFDAARMAARRGQFDVVPKLLGRIALTDPDNRQGYMEWASRALAQAFMSYRMPEKGVAVLKSLRQSGVRLKDPERIIWLLGSLQAYSQDRGAIKTFEEYLQWFPPPDNHASVASFLARTGFALDDAERFAWDAKEADIHKDAHQMALAEVYCAKGKYDLALETAEEAYCCHHKLIVDTLIRRIETARQLGQTAPTVSNRKIRLPR